MSKEFYTGPLDEQPWPTKLTARVLSPGVDVRLHGYSIESDLAAHYSFGETILLALTGSIPTIARGRAFDVALTFLAATTATEAPIHAALLARVCAATTSAISGTGAIALAEQARFDLAPYAKLFVWLEAPTHEAPPAFVAKSAEDRAHTRALRHALAVREAEIAPALSLDLDPTAALLSVLFTCGVRTLEHLETTRVLARYPVLMAEALASPAAKHRDYPVNTPEIRYEEITS